MKRRAEPQQEYLSEAGFALEALRRRVRWKPGKGLQHLEKRRVMGHLPEHTSLEEYNALIGELIGNDDNVIYLYEYGIARYYAVSGDLQGVQWIAIFSKDGVMETAFPPRDIDGYIEKRGFNRLGKIGEVLKWKRKKRKDC